MYSMYLGGNRRWVPRLKSKTSKKRLSNGSRSKDTVNTRCVISVAIFVKKWNLGRMYCVFSYSLTNSHRVWFACGRPRIWPVGLARLCSATFEQRFAFGDTGACFFFRGTLREYSSIPLKHSVVKRILVFKW